MKLIVHKFLVLNASAIKCRECSLVIEEARKGKLDVGREYKASDISCLKLKIKRRNMNRLHLRNIKS